MSIEVNATEQIIEVNATDTSIDINVTNQVVDVNATTSVINVDASNGPGPQGPQGPAGQGVPVGGTTNQVLAKASGANYDTQWVNVGVGSVTSVDASGGVGISVTGGPIVSSGTFTITNTAPDQIVALSGAGTATISGTYPNFTITANDQYTGTVTSVNLTAGTGISVSGGPITSSGSINVVNTAPDQVVSLTGTGTTTITGTYPNFTISSADQYSGTVTSVNMTVPTGFTISGNPITSAGTLALAMASGYAIPTTASQANWDSAYNDKINSASVTGTTTKTLTLTQQDGGTITASWTDIDTGLTSVGLTMPSAFNVVNSPLTSNGTIAVTGAGTPSQYVRGDGSLADFPTSPVGGGASVSYYLNGSVNQGTFGGNTYYEMNKNAILGTGTNFNISSDGYIAQFITDVNDPNALVIPSGNWNFEMYFSASSGGGTPQFYLEVYKYDGTNFTLIGTNSTNPELIAFGTIINPYYTSVAIPETPLAVTDRLAVRVYVLNDGRTITLHTEDNHLCQIITTFTTGIGSLNGLTKQTQYLATGTSGSDFNIISSNDTHTFNLPTASASVRGALSSTDWTTFNNKPSVNIYTGDGTLSGNRIVTMGSYSLTLDGSVFADKITVGTSNNYSNALSVWTAGGTDAIRFTNGSSAGFLYVDAGGAGIFSGATLTKQGIYLNNSNNSLVFYTNGGLQGRVLSTGAVQFFGYGSGTLSGTAAYNLSVDASGNFIETPVAALQSRTLTINGTTYDLSADRTWSVGTVTSVNMSVPTGFAISGNPITSSGTLALAFAAGYSLPTTSSQANWDAAYNDKINSASVTGTTTKTLTLTQQDGGTITASWTDDNTDAVTSVFGRTGAVVAQSGDYTTTQVTEGTNLYYTDARSRAALSFVAGSGAYNSTTGVITIPTNTNQLTNGAAFITLGSLSASAPLSYNNGTGAFTISQASSTTDGFLSSTDWNTFNNKQNALTNPVTGTGTTNYVTKWTSSSAVGNSQIFDNGSAVGIGTATPSGIFEVSGTGVSYFTRGTKSILLNPNVVGANTEALIEVSSGMALTFGTGGSERIRITSGGNVGIGTSSPSGRLDISSANDVYTNIVTSSNNTSAVLCLYNSTGVTDGAAIGYNVAMRFGTITGLNASGFTERMRITSSGLVGINTSSPSFSLDVNGTSRSDIHIFRSNQSAPTADAFIFRPADNSIALGTANTERLRITSSGSVGINTTNPTATLQIGDLANTGSVWNDILITGDRVNANGYYSRLIFKNSNQSGGSSASIRGERSNGSNFATSLTFFTNGTASPGDGSERMRIDSSGNLGLGVTPSAWDAGTFKVIQVSNGLVLGGQVGAASAKIGTNWYYDGAYKYIATGSVSRYDMDGDSHKWYVAPSGTAGNAITFTQAMTLDASGNLAIGSTTALGKLQISTSSGTTIFRSVVALGGTANADNLAIKQDFISGVAANYLWSNSNYMLGVGRNGGTMPTTEADAIALSSFVVNSSGRVGIGTTSPTELLNILGTGDTKLLVETTKVGVDANAALTLKTASDGHWNIQAGNAVSGGLRYVQIGFGERMRITSGGNLLVGTTTDSGERLVVNGTGRFSQSANDYVGFTLLNTNNNASLATSTSIKLGITSTVGTHYGTFKITETSANDNTADFTLSLPFGGVESTKLTIAGSGAATFSSSVTSTSTQYSAIGTGGTYFVNGTGTSANMVIGINGSTGSILQSRDGTSTSFPLLLQPYGGNVGIGTTNPENAAGYATITINGSSGGQITFATSNSKKGYLYNNATNMYIGSESGALIFDAGAIEAMRITSGRNLLLGTTSDNGARLQVSNGNLTIADSVSPRVSVSGNGATGFPGYSLSNTGQQYEIIVRGNQSNALQIRNATASTDLLSFASTGAATFSSSVTAADFRLSALNTAPASASATGTTGEIRIDANYIYVCTATNTWKRVAIATW